MESVFVDENEIDVNQWTNFNSEYHKLKIGEIFQLKDSSLSITCTNCWQEFEYFTEFSLHIQEHYLRGEIAHLKEIKEEPPVEKERETFTISDEDEPENDFEDDDLPITADVECELKDSEMFENSEMDMGWSDNDFDDNIHSIFEADLKTEQPENTQERRNFVEGTDYEKNRNGFCCLTCGREIVKWKHFKEHLETHTNQREVACPICSKLFATVSYVRKHCQRTHKLKIGGQQIKDAQTTTKATVKKARITSTTVAAAAVAAIKATTATKCEPIIEALVSKPKEVKRSSYKEGVHYKKVDNIFQCMKCDRKMAKLDHIKEHLITHKTEKNVYCPFCASAFITESYVRKHVNRTHKLKITSEEIKTAQSSINISRVKKEWAAEKEKSMAAAISEKIGTVTCLFCPKRFTKARYAQKHMRVIHAKPFTINEVKNAQTNKFELNSGSLHAIENGPKLEKNYECYICHKRFTRYNSTQTHMKLHSGTKYVCPYCDRLFAMKAYVRDHISIVHGIKAEDIQNESIKLASCTYVTTPVIESYECYLCRNKFEARANLRKHMRTHLLGPFLCVTCGAIYKSITYFRYHMKSHQADPNIRHECLDALCGKNYKTRHHMMRHYRRMHLGVGKKKPKTKKIENTQN